MLWLAAQVFLLCLLAFLAGAGITYLAVRRRLRARPAAADPGLVPGSEPRRSRPAAHAAGRSRG
ncbi:MAG: hypothetical protein ABW215_04250 [Kibdelosporangium sp.]